MSSADSMAIACSLKNFSIRGTSTPDCPCPFARRMSSFRATYHLCLSEGMDFIPPYIPAIYLLPGKQLDLAKRPLKKFVDPLSYLVRLPRMLPGWSEDCLHDPFVCQR